MAEAAEDRLRALSYELPTVPDPAGSYFPATRAGAFLFTASHLSFKEGQLSYTGMVGKSPSKTRMRQAASVR